MRKSAQVPKVFSVALALTLAAAPGQTQKKVTATLTEYPTPTADSCPDYLTQDSSGALWFTETNASNIAKLNVTKNEIEEFHVPDVFPVGIAFDTDGTLYFSGENNSIGALDPATKKFWEWNFAPISSGTTYGGLAPLGGKIYFADPIDIAIGELNPSTDEITKYLLPKSGSEPGWVVDIDGNLAFTEGSVEIGLLDPTTSTLKEWNPPGTTHPFIIDFDGGDTVWVSDSKTNTLYRLDRLKNIFSEFAPPTPTDSAVYGLSFDSHGNLLFTESGNNSVGMLNLADQPPEKTFKIEPVITTLLPASIKVKPTTTFVTPKTHSVYPTVTSITGSGYPGGYTIYHLPTPSRLPIGIHFDQATGGKIKVTFAECGSPGHVAILKGEWTP